MENRRSAGEVDRAAYLEWYLNHEPKCYLNHDGSSSSMEAAGAVRLYERSVQMRKLRYIPFIGDGDSKAYSQVCKTEPYGPTTYIPKEECVAHVTKRMGTALRSLTKEHKGKKLKDGKGLGGPGRLTLKRIDTMHNFYGRAIRDNVGDAGAMAKATREILNHYSSTLDEPRHQDCPEGNNSWCNFQRDIANDTNLHKPIKDPLSPAIVDVLEPVFTRLGSEQFLAGCERCYTQNANESLHHVIWSIAPKDAYNSSVEISTGIHLGILYFNRGHSHTFTELFPKLALSAGPVSRETWKQIDGERLYFAEYRSHDLVKAWRKKKRKNKLQKEDAFVHQEGITYKSQSFHQGGPPTKKTSRTRRKQKT